MVKIIFQKNTYVYFSLNLQQSINSQVSINFCKLLFSNIILYGNNINIKQIIIVKDSSIKRIIKWFY